MIAYMLSNNKLNKTVIEILIRGRKLNISPAFVTQCYFAVLKDFRLNPRHLFIFENSKQMRTLTNCV